MQHGTGREFVTEALENALAVLKHEYVTNKVNVGDVTANLMAALAIIESPVDLDQRSWFGEDYQS